MEVEIILIIIGIMFGGSNLFLLYILKRLNYTCGIISKIVTFLKLVHPKESNALD